MPSTSATLDENETSTLSHRSSQAREIWKKYLAFPALWWLVSIATSLTAMWAVSIKRHLPIQHFMLVFDAEFYRGLIRDGYLTKLPMVHGKVSGNRDAFFPIFPMLVRDTDKILPGGDIVAFLFVNACASFIAIVIFYQCAQAVLPHTRARNATALMGVFPSAFVYMWMYSEAVAVLLVVVGVTLFVKKHPWYASVAFAIAGLSRPNAAFIGMCVPISFFATYFFYTRPKATKEYLQGAALTLAKCIATSVIAFSGYFAFMKWLDHHTGVANTWLRIQREGWGESTHPFRQLNIYAHHVINFDFTYRVISVAGSAAIYFAILVALFLWCKHEKFSPLTIGLSIPSVVIILLALSNGPAVASLRFGIVAVPIFLALGAVIPVKWSKYVIAFSVVCLFALCVLHSWGFYGPFLMGSP